VDCHARAGRLDCEGDAYCISTGGVEDSVAVMEKRASHAGGSGPCDGPFLGGDVDAIVLSRAKWVDADDCVEVCLRERCRRIATGIAKGCEVVIDRAGGGSTSFGVGEKADAVGTAGALESGLGGDEGFDDLELTKHCGGEDGRPRSLGEQVFGDGTVSHVRGCSQGRFPVAEAPVPCRAGERWPGFDELLNTFEIEVGDHHHLVDEFGRLRGEGRRKWRAGWSGCLRACLAGGLREDEGQSRCGESKAGGLEKAAAMEWNAEGEDWHR